MDSNVTVEAALRLLRGLADSSNAGSGGGSPEEFGLAWNGFVNPDDVLIVARAVEQQAQGKLLPEEIAAIKARWAPPRVPGFSHPT